MNALRQFTLVLCLVGLTQTVALAALATPPAAAEPAETFTLPDPSSK